jgi:hypothetical protein
MRNDKRIADEPKAEHEVVAFHDTWDITKSPDGILELMFVLPSA